MNILLFANTDGNIDAINNIYNMVPEINIGLSLGNLPIVSESTPLNHFYKNGFLFEGQRAQDYFRENNPFNKYTYAMFGEYDDPFIPDEESKIKNLHIINYYFTIDMMGYLSRPIIDINVPSSRRVKMGFLGGYYSSDLWNLNNEYRLHKTRDRKSLALCSEDFNIFNNQKLDYLFTFEAPNQYDNGFKFNGGTEKITELIKETKPILHFHAHLRNPSIGYIGDTLSIGIPQLNMGFYVLNLYAGKVAYCQPGNIQTPIIVTERYHNTKKKL